MTGREIEENRVGVIGNGFENRCIYDLVIYDFVIYLVIGPFGYFHAGVGVAVGELADDETFETRKDAGHAQIIHHTVDVVVSLTYIFEE